LHPNTGDDIRDHTQRATWLGQPFPLQIGLLRRLLERRDEAVKSNQQAN
jgi:aromatic ring-cleaving dioxygenase